MVLSTWPTLPSSFLEAVFLLPTPAPTVFPRKSSHKPLPSSSGPGSSSLPSSRLGACQANYVLLSLLCTSDMTLILLASGHMTGMESLLKASGVFGLIASAISCKSHPVHTMVMFISLIYFSLRCCRIPIRRRCYTLHPASLPYPQGPHCLN